MDDREKTWHGLRAASLSIVPGIGHLYLGERRGYGLLIAGLVLLLIAHLWWRPAELFYVSLVIVSAVDAYGIVKRGYGLF
jgi:hypothetical protein